ncbi:MAG: Lar family restriction alleviation protein [Proteobacteria bacterium]|nr:Lar family restriction alleviation protein [Pseudomonadota bacterium]
MSEETLKPCPFCGGEAESETTICDDLVRCKSCGASIVFDTRIVGSAIVAWNTRPND